MNDNYDKTLEIFKKLQENGVSDTAVQPMQKKRVAITGNSIDELNEAVYGKYDPSEDPSPNNGDKILMETMKEYANGEVSENNRKRVEENIKNLKIPKAILQSMMSQPLLETKIGKDDIDEFMEKQAMKNTNIQASNRIIQKVNEMDAAKNHQQKSVEPSYTNTNSTEYIKEIIENTIERKFSELSGKIKLNESHSGNSPSVRTVQEVDGGKFLLLDTDDNIYECTLVYKGKNKKHR